jgi:hypothetical protein
MARSSKFKVEQRSVAALVPYASNPRTHSDEEVAQVAESISEFGWTNPILVDEADGIIAGHRRLLAAQRLGMQHVPVIVLAHLTDAQKRAYRIADNRLPLNAGWDDELPKFELQELDALGTDLALTGFSPDELNVIFNGWQSDIDLASKHDENGENAINVVLKIVVGPADKDMATASDMDCRWFCRGARSLPEVCHPFFLSSYLRLDAFCSACSQQLKSGSVNSEGGSLWGDG